MASIYANLLEQKKAFAEEKSSTPTGLVFGHPHGQRFMVLGHQYGRRASCENTLLRIILFSLFGMPQL